MTRTCASSAPGAGTRARVALVNVAPLLAAGCHWHIDLTWDEQQLPDAVRDQHAPAGPQLEGRRPRTE